MNVNDIVAARIEAARRKAENEKRQRAELAAARRAGLGYRHAARLRNLAASGFPGSQKNPNSSQETPMPAALRPASCPSCRRERAARLMTTVNVAGAPHDVLRCPAAACELMWLVRAERPRTAPVAA
ncbi:hypothetical protein [Streptomyces hokutonensis]|uniref:Uncharacterized protein n=1 Tax=Streptomyces hokutonensis TaxID=1306990 RepID=A0ABW6M8Z1_9ACTN